MLFKKITLAITFAALIPATGCGKPDELASLPALEAYSGTDESVSVQEDTDGYEYLSRIEMETTNGVVVKPLMLDANIIREGGHVEASTDGVTMELDLEESGDMQAALTRATDRAVDRAGMMENVSDIVVGNTKEQDGILAVQVNYNLATDAATYPCVSIVKAEMVDEESGGILVTTVSADNSQGTSMTSQVLSEVFSAAGVSWGSMF